MASTLLLAAKAPNQQGQSSAGINFSHLDSSLNHLRCRAKFSRKIRHVDSSYGNCFIASLIDSKESYMIKRVVHSLAQDLKSIAWSVMVSILAFILLCIWRLFADGDFIFIQIVWISLLIYLTLLFPFSKRIFIDGFQRLVISLIVFSILSSLLLNIDRSRSVHLLKWTKEVGISRVVTAESIINYKHFPSADLSPIGQRLEEQSQLGTLDKSGSGYSLTLFGRLIVGLSEAVSKLASLNGYKKA